MLNLAFVVVSSIRKRNLQIALKSFSNRIEDKIKMQLRVDDTYATGDLHRSVKANPTQDSIMVYALDYLDFVDRGRKPGRLPPIKEILRWAQAKGIRPRNYDNSKSYRKNMKTMAYFISRAIADNGTIKRFGYKGSGILDFVIETLRPEMTEQFKEAVARDIAENIKQFIPN